MNLKTGVISDVVGAGGLAGPRGQWHFKGTAPDVTPDGKQVVFTVADPADNCGVGITDLSGGGFRQIAQSADCGVFAADDPAVSPNGKKLVYTAGNESPQLRRRPDEQERPVKRGDLHPAPLPLQRRLAAQALRRPS